MENFCELILNLDKWFRRRCRSKIFLSLALVAILLSGAAHFLQFLYRALRGTFLSNYIKFEQVVQEMPF